MKHPPSAGMQLQESYAETKQSKAKQSISNKKLESTIRNH